MASLERRINALEHRVDTHEDGPSLSERLQQALDRAQARARLRQQGITPPEEPIASEGLYGARLQAALERAWQVRIAHVRD